MMYSRRVRPRPSGCMSCRSPLRRPSSSITPPWWASSTSTVSASNGSHFTPSISLKTTRGRDTASS
ncbi:Uncharacterised protein [Bordetella pertussis]|nr:Uncharacterised protein [Bordetella pertussis]